MFVGTSAYCRACILKKIGVLSYTGTTCIAFYVEGEEHEIYKRNTKE